MIFYNFRADECVSSDIKQSCQVFSELARNVSTCSSDDFRQSSAKFCHLLRWLPIEWTQALNVTSSNHPIVMADGVILDTWMINGTIIADYRLMR